MRRNPPSPRRRHLLATLGVVAVAGCGSQDDTQTTDGPATDRQTPTEEMVTTDQPTTTDSPTTTAAPQRVAMGESLTVGDVTVTLSNPRVRRFVSTDTSVAHIEVEGGEGIQYLLVDVSVDGADWYSLPLDVTVDGAEGRTRPMRVRQPDIANEQTFALAVPAEAANTASVVYQSEDGRGYWELSEAVVETFAQIPKFELRTFEVPDTAAKADGVPVTLEIANIGDRDGTFLAEFGLGVLSDISEIALDVPAGETVTHETRLTQFYSTSPESVEVIVNWPFGRQNQTVEITDSG